jgi:CheY-like chemotaxis protein
MKPTLADSAPNALNIMGQRACSGHPFELVLLDAQMPGVDGFELARQIQENPALVGPRIMMLSSVDMRSIGSELHESGHYVVKPVTRTNLLNSILKVLGEVHRRPSPSHTAARTAVARSLHVLLAEDNVVNQRVAARLIERHGHSVEVTSNGTEALAAYTRGVFDLVLMDVQMPEMNGYEVTQAIRQAEEGTGYHVPIVALTAHAMKGDRETCLNAGMDDYLSKPIHGHELMLLLERLVAGSPQPAHTSENRGA